MCLFVFVEETTGGATALHDGVVCVFVCVCRRNSAWSHCSTCRSGACVCLCFVEETAGGATALHDGVVHVSVCVCRRNSGWSHSST